MNFATNLFLRWQKSYYGITFYAILFPSSASIKSVQCYTFTQLIHYMHLDFKTSKRKLLFMVQLWLTVQQLIYVTVKESEHIWNKQKYFFHILLYKRLSIANDFDVLIVQWQRVKHIDLVYLFTPNYYNYFKWHESCQWCSIKNNFFIWLTTLTHQLFDVVNKLTQDIDFRKWYVRQINI